ncbi:helix-turn-helix domain-containing protein [Nonomuraea endophytica]|uniref:DNA-binding transcriptional MerR regulator n=1 Tax=Nonomuraea endophytica TaxID=714136 RepID=A0A7W8AAK2_9ACTN|nr:helix-turn-helix domain-containing protein [Nonomuraea endophytica]MBB5082605.1 DNA-binding transcriptional MerR regulator [Nonomuraea endophytica]
MRETWTIGELAERAADALRPGLQRANGRIREVPGERLIRWYTTIGLVDPPLTRRGRLAQYGRRHLLQVVAVKRLQAEGHSIAEIQTRLTGATDATLEATALLEPPNGDQGGAPGGDLPDGTQAEGPRPRFWTAHPTAEPTPPSPAQPFPRAAADAGAGQREAAVVHGLVGDATREAGRGVARETAQETPRGGGRVSGVRLAAGVVLVLDGAGRTPTDDDIEAVLAAAGPLLQVLQERKLT